MCSLRPAAPINFLCQHDFHSPRLANSHLGPAVKPVMLHQSYVPCCAVLCCASHVCRKEPVGPIEFLRQHNLTVLTKKSAFEPRFHMAFTDPQHDIEASRDFAGFSTLELRLSHIAYHVLHGPCQQGAAVRGSSGPLSDTTSDGRCWAHLSGTTCSTPCDVVPVTCRVHVAHGRNMLQACT